eukprot:scaffold6181_cov129-Isochrysis_galbana.AAC.1
MLESLVLREMHESSHFATPRPRPARPDRPDIPAGAGASPSPPCNNAPPCTPERTRSSANPAPPPPSLHASPGPATPLVERRRVSLSWRYKGKGENKGNISSCGDTAEEKSFTRWRGCAS